MSEDETTPDLDKVMDGRRHEPMLRQKSIEKLSSERLLTIIKTKVNTAFIGAISSFEACMGHLWGHGKKSRDCTPDELKFRELWNECRTKIFTNGNNQIRAMKSEIGQYKVLWNRHHTELEVPKMEFFGE